MNKSPAKRLALSTVIATLVAALCNSLNPASAVGQDNSRSATVNLKETKDSKAQPSELAPGQTVERQLDAGDFHTYRIALKAGEYFHLLVVQQHIDVTLALIDPAGKTIAEVIWETKDGTESLWQVAETTGDYQLLIRAVSGRADPRYTATLAKVGQLQTASFSDRTYASAYQLYFAADELRRQGSDQSRKGAIEKLERSLPLWRALQDSTGEAFALMTLGRVYADSQLGEQSLAFYLQALHIWQQTGKHPDQESDALHSAGAIESSSGHSEAAIAHYKAAIEILRGTGDLIVEASVLGDLGQAYYNRGDFQAALATIQEALRLRKSTGDIEGQARSLSNISAIYSSLGEFQEALNFCKQALALRREAHDRRGEGVTLTNIGSNYRELGQPETALGYYQQALSLMDSPGSDPQKAALLDRMGRAYFDLADYSKALEFYQRSLVLRRANGNQIEEATVLADIGNDYVRMGEPQKALGYFEQVLKMYRDMGVYRGQALALQYAGETYRVLGELPRALACFDEGLALSRAIKSRFLEANLLYAIARTETDTGQVDKGLADVEAAIQLIESSRAKVTSIDDRAAFLASKQDFYELEIDLLMQASQREPGQESLTRAFNVSERRRARSLLDDLEESRVNIREGINPELLKRERAASARLNRAVENQIRMVSGKHSPDDAAALSQRVDTAASEYEQVLTEIRTTSPRYAAVTQPVTLNLGQVQRELLDENTLLLEYALGLERSYVWVVTRDHVSALQLPPRAQIESLAHHVYELMTSRNRFLKFERNEARQARIARDDAEYQQAAAELSRLLLPVGLTGYRKRRVLVVADGALQYLPFAALALPEAAPKDSRYIPLIARYEVINLPSASTLSVLRKELSERQPAAKTIAVIADPVFDKTDERVKANQQKAKLDQHASNNSERNSERDKDDDRLIRALRDYAATDEPGLLPLPRLRFTRLEAEAIASLTSPGERKAATDFAANLATATDPQLSQYRYLHFATHGLLNNRHEELSGIVLSLVDENGNDQNGFLLASDIYHLNLPAELVVLSGCKTGLGKEINGEGILSLTRSFMYAGTARVMVSLWDVNDKSTAELMTQFYRAALGKGHLSPAAALRKAQIAMWESGKWRAPYYWAPFVLEGEYR